METGNRRGGSRAPRRVPGSLPPLDTIGDNTAGLLWILAASALWATYIVIGSRVAQIGPGVAGLGIGLAIGAMAITPIGAPGSGPVFGSPQLLLGCVVVGVFSNAIGYGIDQHVLRRIPVRRFSVLLALLPVTAVAFGWMLLDQAPSGLELAASPSCSWASPSRNATTSPLPCPSLLISLA